MLSAKLAEGKLRIIDSEKLKVPKTNPLGRALDSYDDVSKILVIHSY